MKAVVLVGGEGTRLRPLTETIPKPLLPLVDRAFLHQVLDRLAEFDVREAVLSSPYLEATFQPFLDQRRGEPSVTWITEETPLGTAGAIVNALEHMGDEPFLVLNGDVLTDLDLAELVAFHRQRGAVATIALTPVADARPYGLIDQDEDGRVREFMEKPSELVPGNINAGTYVLEPEALSRWERGRAISIEREVYPELIAKGRPVYGFLSDAYWMDLGTPERYLQAHFDVLLGKVHGEEYPAPFIAESARVDLQARLGRLAVVGEGAAIEPGAEVDESVLMPGAVVGENATVVRSIVGPGAHVEASASVTKCVLGAGARVDERAELTDSKVSSH